MTTLERPDYIVWDIERLTSAGIEVLLHTGGWPLRPHRRIDYHFGTEEDRGRIDRRAAFALPASV